MPAGRAENHAGSIRQLPSGHYGLQVMLGGQRHHVTGATKAEVREKRDALKERHRQQHLAHTRQDRQPVADYLRQWHALRRGTIEPSTWTRYGVEITKRLAPTIGGRPLRALTADDLRGALQQMLEGRAPFTRAYAPRTVQYAHETLSQALQQAVQDGVLARNVAASVKPPKLPKTQARAFNADEVTRLLAASGGDWHTLWLLALYSGLRLGELLGLAWTALDEEAGTVTVRQVLADDEEGGVSCVRQPLRHVPAALQRGPDFQAGLPAGRHYRPRASAPLSAYLCLAPVGQAHAAAGGELSPGPSERLHYVADVRAFPQRCPPNGCSR
jgi:integrase